MNNAYDEGLPCVARPHTRWFTLVITIIGYVLIFTLAPDRAVELTAVFWTYVILRMQFFSPDLVVYDSGVEVRRYGFKTFLRWTDIRYVRVSRFNSQIFPTTIPRWLRVLVYDSLLINSWRDNYKTALELIEERALSSPEQITNRVYD